MPIVGNVQMSGGTHQGAGRNHTYSIPQKTVAIRPSSICLRGGTHSNFNESICGLITASSRASSTQPKSRVIPRLPDVF